MGTAQKRFCFNSLMNAGWSQDFLRTSVLSIFIYFAYVGCHVRLLKAFQFPTLPFSCMSFGKCQIFPLRNAGLRCKMVAIHSVVVVTFCIWLRFAQTFQTTSSHFFNGDKFKRNDEHLQVKLNPIIPNTEIKIPIIWCPFMFSTEVLGRS